MIDGCIIAVPIGIAWNISMVDIIMSIAMYVILQANKLYMRVLAESIMGNTLGQTGRSFVYLICQSAVLGLGVVLGVLGAALISMKLLFPILMIYCILIVMLIMLLASSRFGEMEQID